MIIKNGILEVLSGIEVLVEAVDFWDPGGALLVGVSDRTQPCQMDFMC